MATSPEEEQRIRWERRADSIRLQAIEDRLDAMDRREEERDRKIDDSHKLTLEIRDYMRAGDAGVKLLRLLAPVMVALASIAGAVYAMLHIGAHPK